MSDTDTYTIVTNHVPRWLSTFDEIPAGEQHWFDYVDEDERDNPRFFQYREAWYDVNEFTYVGPSILAGWDGYQSDSYFSGVLVRYADSNMESVVVGRYYN